MAALTLDGRFSLPKSTDGFEGDDTAEPLQSDLFIAALANLAPGPAVQVATRVISRRPQPGCRVDEGFLDLYNGARGDGYIYHAETQSICLPVGCRDSVAVALRLRCRERETKPLQKFGQFFGAIQRDAPQLFPKVKSNCQAP